MSSRVSRKAQAARRASARADAAARPQRHEDIFIEVRAGAGGDEAGIFAGDLLRMYTRYAENHKMRVELLSRAK